MANIVLDIDNVLLNKSTKILDAIGLDFNDVFRLCLKAVIASEGLPPSLELPNKDTLKAFKEVDSIESSCKKYKKYTSSNELKSNLNKIK